MNRLHILSMLAAAMIAAAPSEVNAKPQITTKGDTTTVVAGADTVRLVGGKAIDEAIKSKFNDTVYNGESEAIREDGSETTTIDDNDNGYNMYRIAQVESENRMIKMTVFSIFTAFVLIVFIVALFAYLQRRAKYRMIEKAIDKNYQLPPEITGSQRLTLQDHVPNLWDTPASHKVQPHPSTGNFAESARPAAGGPLNWNAYKRSIMIIIAGFVLVCFFLSIDGTSMAVLCSAILLYGLAQAFFTYQNQRNAASYRPTPPQPPTLPQQPASPQAPAQPSESGTTASAPTDDSQQQ